MNTVIKIFSITLVIWWALYTWLVTRTIDFVLAFNTNVVQFLPRDLLIVVSIVGFWLLIKFYRAFTS